jgi:hypothetical protein
MSMRKFFDKQTGAFCKAVFVLVVVAKGNSSSVSQAKDEFWTQARSTSCTPLLNPQNQQANHYYGLQAPANAENINDKRPQGEKRVLIFQLPQRIIVQNTIPQLPGSLYLALSD